jgi:hypothetical protein
LNLIRIMPAKGAKMEAVIPASPSLVGARAIRKNESFVKPFGGRPFFASPAPAGRQITAGFTWLQRIGKSASFDVWFPQALHAAVEELLAEGRETEPANFPAAWAAVRQFELLQEAGNYKIYDLDVTHLTRAFEDLTRSMRAGGYRVTIATIGGYAKGTVPDELAILDARLQERIATLINMLYLEEQSEKTNAAQAEKLRAGKWDYRSALPHIGVTLGSRDLFRPVKKKRRGGDGGGAPLSVGERRHELARQFFDILEILPQKHIQHDTAIGLQLPESINENQWIYLAQHDETLLAFNQFLDGIFAPFDKISLSGLHEREGAGREIKASVNHMRGYGDRLRPEAEKFYGMLARYAAH